MTAKEDEAQFTLQIRRAARKTDAKACKLRNDFDVKGTTQRVWHILADYPDL